MNQSCQAFGGGGQKIFLAEGAPARSVGSIYVNTVTALAGLCAVCYDTFGDGAAGSKRTEKSYINRGAGMPAPFGEGEIFALRGACPDAWEGKDDLVSFG